MDIRKVCSFAAGLEDEKKLLLLLIFLGLLVRVFNLVTAPAIELDGIGYARAAGDFVHGDFGKALSNIRLPLFPAIIAFFHLFIPDVELAGRVTSLVFGVLLIILCFRFAKELLGAQKAFWMASFIAIHPYLTQYSDSVLSESLATFLFTGCFFFFYRGWTTDNQSRLAYSGAFLAFAYLTKPEYIIYFAPLSFILLFKDRRRRNLPAFLLCCFLIVFAYLIYLRLHTGFWVIDRKILAWGGHQAQQTGIYSYLTKILSPSVVLKNIPAVFYHLCEAVYPPFLLLAILGFKKTNSFYRGLALALIAFHVLGRSFVLHSTKRYSLEFVPIIMVFAVEGMVVVKAFFEDFRYNKQVLTGLLVLATAVLLFQGIRSQNYGREMQKNAGLLLRSYQGEESIAARLPIVTFYSGRSWVDLESMLQRAKTCDELDGQLQSGRVKYLVIDERIRNDFPFVNSCTAGLRAIIEFSRGNDSLQVYQKNSF